MAAQNWNVLRGPVPALWGLREKEENGIWYKKQPATQGRSMSRLITKSSLRKALYVEKTKTARSRASEVWVLPQSGSLQSSSLFFLELIFCPSTRYQDCKYHCPQVIDGRCAHCSHSPTTGERGSFLQTLDNAGRC